MKVLFLCPHGAAKSVVAAAMFSDYATQIGRSDVEVRNAGTEPDDEVNPIAVQALQRLDLPVPGTPRQVTRDDIEWADVVVSLGCTRESLPGPLERWEDWSEAPGVTEDEQRLVAFVQSRIANLLDFSL